MPSGKRQTEMRVTVTVTTMFFCISTYLMQLNGPEMSASHGRHAQRSLGTVPFLLTFFWRTHFLFSFWPDSFFSFIVYCFFSYILFGFQCCSFYAFFSSVCSFITYLFASFFSLFWWFVLDTLWTIFSPTVFGLLLIAMSFKAKSAILNLSIIFFYSKLN